MKIKTIKTIEHEIPIKLIDIGVENDQTFFVSDKHNGMFYLTHNSLPDIDCLLSSTLVKCIDGKKRISSLNSGDFVIDSCGCPRRVLYSKTRALKENECLYKVRVKDMGYFIATGNHKIPNKNWNDLKVQDLKEGIELAPLGNKTQSYVVVDNIVKFLPKTKKITVTDITVENSYFLIYSSKGSEIVSHNSDCADREEAIKILTEHFGEESVLPVSNYNQLQLKSLIKDLARLYQIPFDIINPITQQIEKETLDADKQQDGFDRGVWFLSYESAEKNSPSFQALLEEYPQLESSLRILFKQIKSCFTEETLILTESGWKQFKDIFEDKDKVAYIDTTGEIKFNADFFKIENGEKELYEITFKDGKSIKLTEDHLVQTDKGWKQVKDLCEDDSLIGWI